MNKLKHVNLFAYGDQAEVYAALQRDFNRDTQIQMFWRIVLVACAFGAAIVSHHQDWLWIFGAIYAAERALTSFVDNSNRNWLMHGLDWYHVSRQSHD